MAHVTYELRGSASRAGYARIDAILNETRLLYNSALEHRRTAWQRAGKSISYMDQTRELTAIRGQDPTMASFSVVAQRGALRRLDRAFQAFFRRVKGGGHPGYPRFKSAARWRTIELSQVSARMVRVSPDGSRALLRIKGFPTIRVRIRRALPKSDQLVALRIVRRVRRLDVHLVYDEPQKPRPRRGTAVGLDMGVSSRVTTSDGRHFPSARPDRKRSKRLRRALSRARRGSRSRRRKREAVAREERKLAVQSRNSAHRISSEIVASYDFIACEQLRVTDMVRSAKGTLSAPGTGVAQKRGLNRRISDQGWGRITRQLDYKAAWAGIQFVTVDPKYTSQDCSRCGQRNPGPTPARIYRCCGCGLEMDRDVNAAKNVLRRGLAKAGSRRGKEPRPRRAAARNTNRQNGALAPPPVRA